LASKIELEPLPGSIRVEREVSTVFTIYSMPLVITPMMAIDEDCVDGNAFGELYQVSGVSSQMMDLDRVPFSECRHPCDVRPVRRRREPDLIFAILPKQLHAQSGLLKRRNSLGDEVSFVFVSDISSGPSSPNPRYRGPGHVRPPFSQVGD
jgi:hypothetical protein